MQANRGFTLVELMIAAAIVAILAAIAIPSYSSYILSSRRVDGQASLQRIQIEQEKWRSNNTAYASTLSNLGLPSTSTDGYYALSLSGATSTGYTATATAVGSQTKDVSCSTMTLVVNGATLTTGPAGCWKK